MASTEAVADNHTPGRNGYLFRPLDHGIDISVQALTKYVAGHSDVFMGCAAVNSARLARELDDGIHNLGWAVAGDEAYQVLRGLRTLPTRLARHGVSGLTVAAWLREQPQVVEVFHPALPGARGHDLWKRDFTGACGLFAFALKPAPQAAVDAFLDELDLFGPARFLPGAGSRAWRSPATPNSRSANSIPTTAAP